MFIPSTRLERILFWRSKVKWKTKVCRDVSFAAKSAFTACSSMEIVMVLRWQMVLVDMNGKCCCVMNGGRP